MKPIEITAKLKVFNDSTTGIAGCEISGKPHCVHLVIPDNKIGGRFEIELSASELLCVLPRIIAPPFSIRFVEGVTDWLEMNCRKESE